MDTGVEPMKTPEPGRIAARPPREAPPATLTPGVHPLGIGGARDSYLYVPERALDGSRVPVAVMLHGAGGHAHHGLAALQEQADQHGVVLLAPASRGPTWDVIVAEYGPDVALVDRALDWLFRRCPVDPHRLAIGGFSDGASYALSLGITNGDLFSHVIALSPGFAAPAGRHGTPSVFVSHGTQDGVLPIQACSRRIVPRLQQQGFAVTYHEFQGGHTVPAEVAGAAMDWFLATSP
jgi:phospholipase/carboxylesterase